MQQQLALLLPGPWRDVSNADLFLAPTLLQLWRYQAWKIGSGGCGIHRRIYGSSPRCFVCLVLPLPYFPHTIIKTINSPKGAHICGRNTRVQTELNTLGAQVIGQKQNDKREQSACRASGTVTWCERARCPAPCIAVPVPRVYCQCHHRLTRQRRLASHAWRYDHIACLVRFRLSRPKTMATYRNTRV